jgi:parallel beta-helix repeat protein
VKTRVIVTIVILCLLGIMEIVTPLRACKAQSLEVWVPTQYPTIQDGVNAVAEYGVVHVLAGTYYEYVTINKPLTLAGQNKATTIIDGSKGNGEEVVNVSGTHDVKICGFTIQNGSCGVQLRSGGNNVTGNIVHDRVCGIGVGTSYNVISGNVIYGNEHGIVIFGAACYNKVTFNILFDNEGIGGICIHAKSWPGGLPSNNTICFNFISKNHVGIQYPTLKENPEGGNTILTVIKYPPAYGNVILPNWNTENIVANWEPYSGYVE